MRAVLLHTRYTTLYDYDFLNRHRVVHWLGQPMGWVRFGRDLSVLSGLDLSSDKVESVEWTFLVTTLCIVFSLFYVVM